MPQYAAYDYAAKIDYAESNGRQYATAIILSPVLSKESNLNVLDLKEIEQIIFVISECHLHSPAPYVIRAW